MSFEDAVERGVNSIVRRQMTIEVVPSKDGCLVVLGGDGSGGSYTDAQKSEQDILDDHLSSARIEFAVMNRTAGKARPTPLYIMPFG